MNKWRGESQVKLNGSTYTLRPTLQAIMAIESEGPSVVKLAMSYRDRDISYVDAVNILYHGLVTEGEPRKDKAYLMKCVSEQGILQLLDPVGAFLEAAIDGLGPTTGESPDIPSKA